MLIAWTVTKKSLPVFRHEGLRLLHRTPLGADQRGVRRTQLHLRNGCDRPHRVVISVPISLGIALFTTQVAPPRLKKWLVSLTDLVAVVPSVVFGLWGIIFLAPKLVPFFKNVSGWFHGWPILGDVFGQPRRGRTFMTAGLILSVMITPIITSIAREVIETCPADRPRWSAGTGRDTLGDDHRCGAAPLDDAASSVL